jgi:hypothetical protein
MSSDAKLLINRGSVVSEFVGWCDALLAKQLRARKVRTTTYRCVHQWHA